jgi:HmuY protein
MMSSQKIILVAAAVLVFTACKKDVDPVFIVPPSTGAEIKFNGIAGSESGAVAGNAVYLDLSGDRQTAVLRSGWDLGFYCGADFRVILNNGAVAGAKMLLKNNLNDVGAADTIGLTLTTSQFNPLPEQLPYFDNITGDLTKTVIPAVSAIDTDNKVIILNRGIGGGIAARPWIKFRILRNAAGGYSLQYAGIQETTFKTIQIPKDAAYHFKFVAFENGIIEAQPEKEKWDLVWSYSVYEANFGAGPVPYNFSDLIAVNYLSGVTVATKIYANAATASAAYIAFNKDSIANTVPSTNRWAIGSSWRSTQPATGARLDRFYIIKDASGNYYKFKCLSMGIGSDGGTRGKPEFKYILIN